MPRGPYDDGIEERNPDLDHARKRREEFLRERGSKQHASESVEEARNPQDVALTHHGSLDLHGSRRGDGCRDVILVFDATGV